MKKITKPSDTVLIDPNEPLILPDGTALVGRIEWFLYALCCLDYQNLPTPMSRIEEFANALITGEIPNIEPQSRAEQFFLAILDGNVSNLPQPQSRSEVLLDKLARGEFDLSDVEPIQSHYELLLAYLIKNGGIGNIDYVLYEFSEAMKTMYNTVEKPFKSLELSGNTKVNVLQESVENDVVVPYQVDECQGVTLTGTKETGSLDNLVINGRTLVNSVLEDTSNSDYVSFDQDYEGQSFTINGTNEGAIKNAILKGQTLVNFIKNKYNQCNLPTSQDVVADGANTTFDSAEYRIKQVDFTMPLTVGKEYLFTINVKSMENINYLGVYVYDGTNTTYPPALRPTKIGLNVVKYTPTSPIKQMAYYVDAENGKRATFGQPMIIEYQEGMENWEIPYFTGMQSVKLPVLCTTGKNLFDGKFEFGEIAGGVNDKQTKYVKSTSYISIKPNTNYFLSCTDGYNSTGGRVIAWYDSNRNFISHVNNKGVSPSNAYFARIRTRRDDSAAMTGNEISTIQAQFEESSSATSYEPHKTNILHTTEEVVLRSLPNGVCDTFNAKTGEYVQRIGELIFDGSNDEQWSKDSWWTKDETVGFEIPLVINSVSAWCNKLYVNTNFDNFTKTDKEQLSLSQQWQILGIRVLSTKLASQDVNGLRTYLQSNPITVQYELVEPIVTTIDLSIVDQNNTKIDKMHVFNEVTHVNASSDELIPMVNISKSVSYPTIIKPNTKYTVDLKRNDKPLTVNLGGTEVTFASDETRKVITTPSTLTNDKLSYYGMGQKCSNIMVLEGEVEGNVDYFTGMQSVKAPTVSTVGKNVVNEKIWKIEAEEEGYQCLLSAGWATDVGKSGNPIIIPVHVEKGKVYTLKCKNKATRHFNDFYFMDDLLDGKVKSFRKSVGRNSTLNSFVDTIITFTADRDYKYLQIDTGNGEAKGYIVKNTLQLEESSIATPYEPYKSTILSLLEEVKLCSIDNTKDMIDYSTKTLTKNINEVVFDGSDDENWRMYPDSERDNTLLFQTGYDIPFGKNHHCISDKYKHNSSLWNTNFDEEGIMIGGGGSNYKRLDLRIAKNKLSSYNVDGLKSYLQSNPITVQYRLAEPTIEQVDTLIVDHDNISQTKLNTFNDTTHIMTSSDELIPIIKCDGKLEYPVVIKPSTQYTILANTSANAHALNNIAFDLGGAKVTNTFGTRKITITTSSTLANNSLTITGEGAKIGELMVLEGNESDIVPYFEGMSSCKMPILHTIGKNIVKMSEYNVRMGATVTSEGKNWVTFDSPHAWGGLSYVLQLKPNTTYSFSFDREDNDTKGYVRHWINNSEWSGGVGGGDNHSFTTNDTGKIYLSLESATVRNGVTVKNLILEESPINTQYEDYKSSILSYNDDVTLRGTGDVRDTLDCLTGEIVERVGVGVFDGSEDEGWQLLDSNDNYVTFVTYRPLPNIKDNKNSICDKLPFQGHMTPEDGEYHSVQSFGSYINVLSSKASNVVEFKNWLSQNNLTIYYPLTTESIKTVDLSVVDQDGNTIPKVKSYNGTTHLEVTIPKQSLLPNISAEVATDNSKDMSSLTTKHQEISETQSAIQDNIQFQSDEIDTALMATTEIFESILE